MSLSPGLARRRSTISLLNSAPPKMAIMSDYDGDRRESLGGKRGSFLLKTKIHHDSFPLSPLRKKEKGSVNNSAVGDGQDRMNHYKLHEDEATNKPWLRPRTVLLRAIICLSIVETTLMVVDMEDWDAYRCCGCGIALLLIVYLMLTARTKTHPVSWRVFATIGHTLSVAASLIVGLSYKTDCTQRVGISFSAWYLGVKFGSLQFSAMQLDTVLLVSIPLSTGLGILSFFAVHDEFGCSSSSLPPSRAENQRETALLTLIGLCALLQVMIVASQQTPFTRIAVHVETMKLEDRMLEDVKAAKESVADIKLCADRQMKWIGQVAHDIGTSLQVISLASDDVSTILQSKVPKGHPVFDLLLCVQSTVELLIVMRQNAMHMVRDSDNNSSSTGPKPSYEPVAIRNLIEIRCARAINILLGSRDDSGDRDDDGINGLPVEEGSSPIPEGGEGIVSVPRTPPVKLTVDICPDIATHVWTDGVWVFCCVMNLLSNALKFTPRGGSICLSVKIIQKGRQQMLSVRVKDTGCGVQPSLTEGLFTAFVCGGGALNKGGTGLGLYSVMQKCTGLGGTAGLESTSSAGSVFFFEIPYVPCEHIQRDMSTPPHHTLQLPPPCSPSSGVLRGRIVSSSPTNYYKNTHTHAHTKDIHASSTSVNGATGDHACGDKKTVVHSSLMVLEPSIDDGNIYHQPGDYFEPLNDDLETGLLKKQKSKNWRQRTENCPVTPPASDVCEKKSEPETGNVCVNKSSEGLYLEEGLHMSGTGRRILLVDDSPTILKHVSRMLRQSGYIVATAVDGIEALELLRRSLLHTNTASTTHTPVHTGTNTPTCISAENIHDSTSVLEDSPSVGGGTQLGLPFSAIITDADMQVCGGIEMLQKYRSIFELSLTSTTTAQHVTRPYIIIFSGDSPSEEGHHVADRWLMKPVPFSTMLEELRHGLDLRDTGPLPWPSDKEDQHISACTTPLPTPMEDEGRTRFFSVPNLLHHPDDYHEDIGGGRPALSSR